MPPLLDSELYQADRSAGLTKFVGTTCEQVVSQYLLYRGLNVAVPTIDNGVDLLFEENGVWSKAQIKKVVTTYTNNRRYFTFPFNSTKSNSRFRTSSFYDVDYFFHVIYTPHRQLLFQIPDSVVPRREDGISQIMCKDITLDRYNRVHSKKKNLEVTDYLVYSLYSPKIIRAYPDFPF